jgi:hypothetical protein
MALELSLTTYRRTLAWSLGAITLFGLITKFYSGPGRSWLNDSFGGIPYVVFWVLLGALIWPRLAPARVAGGVFVATVLLEFLQLWQPEWLQAIRATLLGRLVLGNTFTWGDFGYYAIGAWLAWLGLRWLRAQSKMRSCQAR